MLAKTDDAAADPIAPDVAAIDRIRAVPTILEVVCRTTGMGFAAVARVTDVRWVACAVRDEIAFGLEPGGELAVETTICHEIRRSGRLVAIDHVAEDATWCGHPAPRRYGFQSYISVPIVMPDGTFFGTLCAIDPRPLSVSRPEIVNMFKLFAELIAHHLDAGERLLATETAVSDERRDAELREQFIAVLGHDLRNPLASIEAGTKLLRREPQTEKGERILTLLQASVGRMAELVDNVLDFARGRLGGGLALEHIEETTLDAVFDQVIEEYRTTSPERTIETALALAHPVRCDPARIAQLLSNLLANALAHGEPDAPVRVAAGIRDDAFQLSVAHAGDPIPPAIIARLFQPFFRREERSGRQRLGLGLYIAQEIARAHGGEIEVLSTDHETVFVFRMALT
jgi:signal transduction histidine kinase